MCFLNQINWERLTFKYAVKRKYLCGKTRCHVHHECSWSSPSWLWRCSRLQWSGLAHRSKESQRTLIPSVSRPQDSESYKKLAKRVQVGQYAMSSADVRLMHHCRCVKGSIIPHAFTGLDCHAYTSHKSTVPAYCSMAATILSIYING